MQQYYFIMFGAPDFILVLNKNMSKLTVYCKEVIM